MRYGHASLIPIAVFGGLFLIRYLSSQRRRGRPPVGGPGHSRPFTTSGPRGPAGPTEPAPPTVEGDPSGSMPAGWFRDPSVRHEQRFWSGAEWTDHVMDDGVPSTDPAAGPPRSSDVA